MAALDQDNTTLSSTHRNPLASAKPTDRMIIIGKTGSGKTYFARYLLASAPRLVVLDPKGLISRKEWELQGWSTGYRQLQRGKPARIYVPPPLDDTQWEAILWLVYNLGKGPGHPPIVLYIDELYAVGPDNGSPALRALYTRGRELGIAVVASTQRPKRIPPFALSEAEIVVLFQTRMPQDVELMHELIPNLHLIVPENKPLTDHNLVIYNVRDEQAVRIKSIVVRQGHASLG